MSNPKSTTIQATVFFNNVKRETQWSVERQFNDEDHLSNFINRVQRNKNHVLDRVESPQLDAKPKRTTKRNAAKKPTAAKQ